MEPEPSQIDLYAICHAIVDRCYQVPSSFLAEQKIEPGSQQLIDVGKLKTLLTDLGDYPATLQCGGTAINTCYDFNLCGGKSAVSYACGENELGRMVRNELMEVGVHVLEKAVQEVGTGTCVTLITENGERTMLTYRGAASTTRISDASTDSICQSKIFLLSSYLFCEVHDFETLRKLCKLAGENDTKVALSLAAVGVINKWRKELLEIVPEIDILFGNREETLALYETDNFDLALSQLKELPLCSVITLGAEGALAIAEGQQISSPAQKVEVISTVGAGDAFAAGFLYGLIGQESIESCLSRGNEIAAKVVASPLSRLSS